MRRALVPVDSDAAVQVSAPNYDEFQGDEEIFETIRARPLSVLRVTMAHCDVPDAASIGEGDSPEALQRAAHTMRALAKDPATRVLEDVVWVYEIVDPSRPGVRQIGLGGMARTDQIRTPQRPDAPIIRNEGVREAKARGRADLIEATRAIIGTVNNAVDDDDRSFHRALLAYADAHAPDLEVEDERGNTHRVWLVPQGEAARTLIARLEAEPVAYVADGNHRSAAAAMLGHEHFLAVFFPAHTMGIRPYNRLVREAAKGGAAAPGVGDAPGGRGGGGAPGG
ncbi:MAG: DUF1015 family protein, partial [Gemmatimonadetes bacterium]